MRNMNRAAAATVALALALAGPAAAEESAAFLKIGTGARAIGMGNAYTAVANDVDALYWNPGGLSLLDQREVGATHVQMFQGDTYDAISIAIPLGHKRSKERREMFTRNGNWNTTAVYGRDHKRGVIAFGVTRLGQSSLEGRGADRAPTGSFDASDMAFTAAYARRIAGGLHGGIAVKRIESRIANASAGATAVDMGTLYRFQGYRDLSLGVSVRNLGSGLKFADEASQLPLTFSAGAAFEPIKRLLVSGEVSHRPYANRSSISLGTEFAILPALALRAGYLHHELAKDETSPLIGSFGGGIGLRWNKFTLDYSLAPYGALGSIQSASLKARF